MIEWLPSLCCLLRSTLRVTYAAESSNTKLGHHDAPVPQMQQLSSWEGQGVHASQGSEGGRAVSCSKLRRRKALACLSSSAPVAQRLVTGSGFLIDGPGGNPAVASKEDFSSQSRV